jgi:hypothetical protein
MSLKTWIEEFYPVPASKMSDKDAILHALKKFTGARKCNLKKHNLTISNATIEQRNGDSFYFGVQQCSLCKSYFYLPNIDNRECPGCPLEQLGDPCPKYHSTFDVFCENGNPIPMIKLLKRALRECKCPSLSNP